MDWDGLAVMRMPLDHLYSNCAYMVIAALAWTLKAWYGLLVPEETESRRVVRRYIKEASVTAMTLPSRST